ncbi:MAG: fumarate hydratase [Candidatus Ancaeobacter aquaticus]|nr:fumarate hydratase [Candidatus Ancaeobacter aquaticus]
MVRKIHVKELTRIVQELCLDANINAPKDVMIELKKSLKKEKSDLAAYCLQSLVDNARIAKDNKLALCQDTGMVVVFLEIGQDVHLVGGDLSKAIDKGVRQAYKTGYFRNSVVDPLSRKNTGDNTPAIIHTTIVPGSRIKISVSPKGFGSENMSAIKMFNPTASIEDITLFIVETVKVGGARPCPPVIVGVGIGGTFEKAALLSKHALMEPINNKKKSLPIRKVENVLLKKINALGIGPQGVGGKTTALKVNVMTHPTHIAGLPVAVNICCHALRHKEKII